MAVCRFFERGYCRNGAACNFEHPGANSAFGTTNAGNRFSALSGTSTKIQDGTNPYKISKDLIKSDLENERPTWILSSYGPGKDAPEQLFGGYPREQSLEEVMVHIRGSANPEQAKAEVEGLYNQAQQQIQTTLGNLDGALQFILSAENKHPNRNDICKRNTRDSGTNGVFAVKTGFADNPLTSNPSANQNPFSTTIQSNPFGGGGASSGTPAFGQPSTLGQEPNRFGGATQSTFGQPSQLGVAAPAFGQPSQLGAPAPAFRQPSQLGAPAPAFRQPSQLGAPAPAFGQPSQLGAGAPAFGQTSTLGQKPNPFAAASSQPAFGQPSTLGQAKNPFGAPSAPVANPFSQVAASTASPFSQVAQAGAQTAAANPFTQATASSDQPMDTSTSESAPANPFAAAQPNTNSAFSGTPANNPFGASSATNSAFGTNSQAQSNPFARPAPSQPQAQDTTKARPYAPGSTGQHPQAESYITKSMDGQITAFRNQPIIYKWNVNGKLQDQVPLNPTPDQGVPGVRNPDGSWRKILFPNGPPSYNKDTEPDPAQYTHAVKAAYAQMAATGRFQGDMPEVPPMREDCVWTF